MMKLLCEEKKGCVLIRPSGFLDLTTHLLLKKNIRDMIDDGHVKFLIDMSGVDAVDSTGIGTLVGLLNSARSRGGDICLAGEIKPCVLDTLRLCGLTNVFRMFNDVEEGLKNWGQV